RRGARTGPQDEQAGRFHRSASGRRVQSARHARLLDALLLTPRLRGRLFFVGHALTLCFRGGLFLVVHVAPALPVATAFPGAFLATFLLGTAFRTFLAA